MKLKKEFNRIGGLFGESVDKVQHVTGDLGEKWRDEARHVSRQARRGLRQGRKSLAAAESALEEQIRGHTTWLIVIGVALAGVLLARLLTSPRVPVRRDW